MRSEGDETCSRVSKYLKYHVLIHMDKHVCVVDHLNIQYICMYSSE